MLKNLYEKIMDYKGTVIAVALATSFLALQGKDPDKHYDTWQSLRSNCYGCHTQKGLVEADPNPLEIVISSVRDHDPTSFRRMVFNWSKLDSYLSSRRHSRSPSEASETQE